MPKSLMVKSTLIALICSISFAAYALADAGTLIDVPAGDLLAALQSLERQADIEVVYQAEQLRGIRTQGLSGTYSAKEALALLLKGTPLVVRTDESTGVMLITPMAAAPATSSAATGDEQEELRLAQVEEAENGATAGEQQTAPKGEEGKEEGVQLEEIVVTGTHIRNVPDQFSPVTRVARDDMELAGNTTVFQAIDNLPQNFGGGASPDTSPPLSIAGAGAAGVNLRGLGNEATLVLVNGRRLAPGGAVGGFVDISSIPVSAIDHIDVLTDGASAIYGADAVAGVVNIIMREDFRGAETRLGYSGATEGGAPAFTLGQTFGWTGDRAQGLVAFEYTNEEELLARDKDFSRGIFPDSQLLTPSSEKYSVFSSGGFDLSDRVKLSGEAYYNNRRSTSEQSPFFGVFLPATQRVESEQYGAAAGINWRLQQDWEADLSAVLSRSDYYAAGTQDQRAFGLGILRTVDSPYSDVASVDVSIGGPVLRITDEPVRAVLGIHGRSESIELSSYYPPSPTPFDVFDKKSRDVHSVFGEVYAPIISENSQVPGVHRLAFTAAIRYDDYNDFGSTTNPRYGIVWSPVSGLTFRGTYGTSFRAPSLEQARDAYTATGGVYVDPQSPTGTSVALALGGQRKELGPETADVWTAGFDFAPDALGRFDFRLTYFNIDYADRIDFPSFVFTGDLEFTDFTGTLVRNPSLQDVQDYLANAINFVDVANSGAPFPPFDPDNVVVILDTRLQNLASSLVEGVDMAASYGMSNGLGDWTFSLSGTWLTTYEQQAGSLAPLIKPLNTFGKPVDLRLRGAIQFVSGATTTSLFVNYVDDYRDTASTTPSFRIDGWATFDAAIRLDLERIFGVAGHEASLTLTAKNILDERPPRIGDHPADLAVYDPANSDPAGRRLGVVLTKRW